MATRYSTRLRSNKRVSSPPMDQAHTYALKRTRKMCKHDDEKVEKRRKHTASSSLPLDFLHFDKSEASKKLSGIPLTILRKFLKTQQNGGPIYHQKRWTFADNLKKKAAVGLILSRYWSPYTYLRKALREGNPLGRFEKGRVTSQVTLKNGFWEASGCRRRIRWWPREGTDSLTRLKRSFGSVVHFVQPEAGTGVHLGSGLILTCAHVVCADADDEEDKGSYSPPDRRERTRLVMFPSGGIYVARCVFASESLDGCVDCALLQLQGEEKSWDTLPSSRIASAGCASKGSDCFIVGNPSNIDLESNLDQNTGIDPKLCGPSPNPDLAGIVHSCWTYWGHSGAPVFGREGEVVSIHSSWDPDTGARLGVSLEQLQTFLNSYKKSNTLQKK